MCLILARWQSHSLVIPLPTTTTTFRMFTDPLQDNFLCRKCRKKTNTSPKNPWKSSFHLKLFDDKKTNSEPNVIGFLSFRFKSNQIINFMYTPRALLILFFPEIHTYYRFSFTPFAICIRFPNSVGPPRVFIQISFFFFSTKFVCLIHFKFWENFSLLFLFSVFLCRSKEFQSQSLDKTFYFLTIENTLFFDYPTNDWAQPFSL
jgi:hypothetical protein